MSIVVYDVNWKKCTVYHGGAQNVYTDYPIALFVCCEKKYSLSSCIPETFAFPAHIYVNSEKEICRLCVGPICSTVNSMQDDFLV